MSTSSVEAPTAACFTCGVKLLDAGFTAIFSNECLLVAPLHFESWSTIYSHFDFGLKNSSFWLPYQSPGSSTDCARELFKDSDGSASLVDCTR